MVGSIHTNDHWMLGMKWKGQLFVDKASPFGLQLVHIIFNALVEALAFIIIQKGVKGLNHYLDFSL